MKLHIPTIEHLMDSLIHATEETKQEVYSKQQLIKMFRMVKEVHVAVDNEIEGGRNFYEGMRIVESEK